jgi:hypothetical protein
MHITNNNSHIPKEEDDTESDSEIDLVARQIKEDKLLNDNYNESVINLKKFFTENREILSGEFNYADKTSGKINSENLNNNTNINNSNDMVNTKVKINTNLPSNMEQNPPHRNGTNIVNINFSNPQTANVLLGRKRKND